MCWGLNSHYFHIIVDGHQPNSRGLYTLMKDEMSLSPILRLLTMAHISLAPETKLGPIFEEKKFELENLNFRLVEDSRGLVIYNDLYIKRW